MTMRPKRLIVMALGLCWLASLALPAAQMADGFKPKGFALLMGGWAALAGLQPAWLANPLLAWAALLLGARSDAGPWAYRIAGLMLLICGAAALRWSDLPDEVAPNPVERFGPGFYLWMLAVWGGGITALARSFAMERT